MSKERDLLQKISNFMEYHGGLERTFPAHIASGYLALQDEIKSLLDTPVVVPEVVVKNKVSKKKAKKK